MCIAKSKTAGHFRKLGMLHFSDFRVPGRNIILVRRQDAQTDASHSRLTKSLFIFLFNSKICTIQDGLRVISWAKTVTHTTRIVANNPV